MKACVAVALFLCASVCLGQLPGEGRRQSPAAYPESEAEAAWRGLAASYVRKAPKDKTLDTDPALNARIDTVMAKVGAAILSASGYDAQRALGLFDKLAALEGLEHGQAADSHDAARVRKQTISSVFADLRRR